MKDAIGNLCRKMLGVIWCGAIGFTLSSTAAVAHEAHCGSDHHSDHHCVQATRLGVCLEKKFWEDVKEHDWKCIHRKINPIFQGILSINNCWVGTPVDQEGEIDILKTVDLQCFRICNARGLLSHDCKTLTLTYTFIATGVMCSHVFGINNQIISVWRKGEAGWQWIAHAGFTPF